MSTMEPPPYGQEHYLMSLEVYDREVSRAYREFRKRLDRLEEQLMSEGLLPPGDQREINHINDFMRRGEEQP